MNAGLLLALIIGLAAGVVSGMGIGGGTILIPCLTLFLEMKQQTAQGVNLLFFIPTAAIALITHIKNKTIDKELVKRLIPYGLAGALAGAFIAVSAEEGTLRKLFGFFLLAVGLYELFRKENSKKWA